MLLGWRMERLSETFTGCQNTCIAPVRMLPISFLLPVGHIKLSLLHSHKNRASLELLTGSKQANSFLLFSSLSIRQ